MAEEKDDNSQETSSGASPPPGESQETSGSEAGGANVASGEAPDGSGVADEVDGARDLEFILDIPLEISVELGRTEILVTELLRLGQGSIVELSKLADEPMDIYVNRRLFARGEVVVVNDKFAIRLTDIISPTERVESLGRT